MVRQLDEQEGGGAKGTHMRAHAWKASAAILIAAAGLLWHILACVESPMSFSPEGNLAFVTMEPYGGDDLAIAGTHAFRLMVVSKEKKLRVIEQTTSHMLTGPAYSPDGKSLCYLRIRLLGPKEEQHLEELLEKRKEAARQATSREAGPIWPSAEIPVATTQAVSQPSGEHEDLTLPPAENLKDLFDCMSLMPAVPAELVFVDAATGRVNSSIRVELPILQGQYKDIEMEVFVAYLLTRLRYSPDGKWVYLFSSGLLMAVNPATGDRRLMAAPAAIAAISPDGKMIAAFQEKALGLIQADGKKATYLAWERWPSLSGLAWMDNKTLVILGQADNGKPEDKGKKVVIDFVTADGRRLDRKVLDLPGQGDEDDTGELVIAPDGKHMVISFGGKVHFMTPDGKVLKSWEHKDDLLVQPTFTPDSKQVAFKYMYKEERRAAAIVFFTPEGKEVSRVAIPRIKPGTTRPASQPATRALTVPAGWD